MQGRATPVRRVNIPKRTATHDRSGWRRWTRSSRAMMEVILTPIYEEEFEGSAGFRGRGAHDALDAPSSTGEGGVDADIRKFFDTLPGMADAVPGAPRGPKGSIGKCRAGVGRQVDTGKGDDAGIGDITAIGERLPALRAGPVGGEEVATAGGSRRDVHRALPTTMSQVLSCAATATIPAGAEGEVQPVRTGIAP